MTPSAAGSPAAAVAGDGAELAAESADLIYHLLVLLNARGLALDDVLKVLRGRAAGGRQTVPDPAADAPG